MLAKLFIANITQEGVNCPIIWDYTDVDEYVKSYITQCNHVLVLFVLFLTQATVLITAFLFASPQKPAGQGHLLQIRPK